MKLAPGERSILAWFSAGPDAEASVVALKESGFADAGMDRVGQFGYAPDVDGQRPAISGAESSSVNAVMEPTRLDDGSRILMAAFPENSGMAGPITVDRSPFLVTVVTQEDLVSKAVGIIEQHGGRV